MTRFAAQTTVSSDRSRAEIERLLSRYGADAFMYGWGPERAMISFQMNGRQIKFLLPIPDRNERQFTHTPAKDMPRSDEAATQAYEQAVRQRWRALALVIKAKLEAVESGITVFEEEFLAHIVMPDGKTIGEHALPQIESAYQSGKMPPLLPHYG